MRAQTAHPPSRLPCCPTVPTTLTHIHKRCFWRLFQLLLFQLFPFLVQLLQRASVLPQHQLPAAGSTRQGWQGVTVLSAQSSGTETPPPFHCPSPHRSSSGPASRGTHRALIFPSQQSTQVSRMKNSKLRVLWFSPKTGSMAMKTINVTAVQTQRKGSTGCKRAGEIVQQSQNGTSGWRCLHQCWATAL